MGEGMMEANDQKRKEQVAHIIEIPDEYVLVVDDEKMNEKVHLLWWEKCGKPEESIQVCLRKEDGELLELSVRKETMQKLNGIAESKAKEIADVFIKKHAPYIHGECNFIYVTSKKECIAVEYKQEVHGCPLPRTGCVVEIDLLGNIITFRNEGIKERPAWPSSIIKKEVILDKLRKKQEVELVFVHLSHGWLAYENREMKDGYNLVYEPITAHAFINPCTGADLHDRSHYIIETAPLPSLKEKVEVATDVYKLLHIDTTKMKKVHEKTEGRELTSVWTKLSTEERQRKDNDKSFDTYCRQHIPILQYEEATTITMDQETNQLLTYCKWGKTACEEPILTREECLEKALQFLGKVFPNFEEYLRIWKNQEDDEDPGHFNFYVYVNGIRIEGEMVRVVVDASSGEVDMYRGVAQHVIEQLLSYDTNVKVNQETALSIYCQALDVRLKWFEECETNPPQYQLVYVQTTGKMSEGYGADYENRKEIRYIDAHTGEKIWSK